MARADPFGGEGSYLAPTYENGATSGALRVYDASSRILAASGAPETTLGKIGCAARCATY